MESRAFEIVVFAIGSGVATWLAFDFFWSVVPSKWLDKLDFKPLNCYLCISGWVGLIVGFICLEGFIEPFSYAGLTVLATHLFNKMLTQ